MTGRACKTDKYSRMNKSVSKVEIPPADVNSMQGRDIEVPSQVDGKRRYLARVSDFVSWDEACRVPRHKITHAPLLELPLTQHQ